MNCYIHVPFCRSKCGYCAFYSEANAENGVVEQYLDKLEKDVKESQILYPQTIYIGGGTPTLLSVAQLKRLFGIISGCWRPNADCEISIECNPETLTPEKAELLRSFVTRISLGIQSFDPALRKTLGRNCSQSAIIEAVKLIQTQKFNHFNCDLIYGIPGQTLEMWRSDIGQAVKCGIDHVSCYSLTPEEQSVLGGTFLIDDDSAVSMYEAAQHELEKHSINRYEISNYAAAGAECRHNVNVWRGGKLAAFGPSGAGFDGVTRSINSDNIRNWLDGELPEKDTLIPEARCREIFAVNLRTVSGWNRSLWQHNAVSWDEMREIFRTAMESIPERFYIINEDSVRLTPDGLLYWNDIAERVIL